VTTMVIERKTLPKAVSSLFRSPHVHIRVEGETDRLLLTPAKEADDDDDADYVDGPDSRYIDPDDYPDTTAYLNAIPGFVESIREMENDPNTKFTTIPRSRYHV